MKLNDRQTDERYRRNIEDDLLFLYSYFKKTSEKKMGKELTCTPAPVHLLSFGWCCCSFLSVIF